MGLLVLVNSCRSCNAGPGWLPMSFDGVPGRKYDLMYCVQNIPKLYSNHEGSPTIELEKNRCYSLGFLMTSVL